MLLAPSLNGYFGGLQKAIFHHGFSNDGKFDTSQEQLQFLSQSHRGVELFARKAAALQYLKQAAKVHAVMVRQLPAEFK